MPTVTKQKRSLPADIYAHQVEIGDEDRIELLRCLEIDPLVHGGKARDAIQKIEEALTHHVNLIRRGTQEPLPAHIVADIKRTRGLAEQLAEWIHANRLPIAVARELTLPELDDGTLWDLLTRLVVKANLAEARLRVQPTSGMHNKLAAERRDAIHEALIAQFAELNCVPPNDLSAYKESLAEFSEICLTYLPTS